MDALTSRNEAIDDLLSPAISIAIAGEGAFSPASHPVYPPVMRLYVLLLMASSIGSGTVVYVRLDTTNQSLAALPANLINQCTKSCEKTVGCSGFSVVSLHCSLLSLPLPSAPSSISFVRTTSAAATCPAGSKHFASFGPSGPQSTSISSSGGQTSASTASSLSQATGVTHEAGRQTSVASILVGTITTMHSNEGETSSNGRASTMKSGTSGTSELSTATTSTQIPSTTSASTSTASTPSNVDPTSSTNHQSTSTPNHPSSSTSTAGSAALFTTASPTSSTTSSLSAISSTKDTVASTFTSMTTGRASSITSSSSTSSSPSKTSTTPIHTSTSTSTSTVTSVPATSTSIASTSSMASSASTSTTSIMSSVISTSSSTSIPSTTTTTPLTTSSTTTTMPSSTTSTTTPSTTAQPTSSSTTVSSTTTTIEPMTTSTSTSITTTTPSTTSTSTSTSATTTTASPTTTEYNIIEKFKFVDVPGSNVSCYYEKRTKGRFSTNGLCALEGSDPCKVYGLVSVFRSCVGKKALTVVPDWQCASTLSYKNSLCVPWEAMFADKVNPTENGIFSNNPSCASGTGLVDEGGNCAPNPYGAKMMTGRFTDNLLGFSAEDAGIMISSCWSSAPNQPSYCPVHPGYPQPKCPQSGGNIGWIRATALACEANNFFLNMGAIPCNMHSMLVSGSGGSRCIGWDSGSTTTPFSESQTQGSSWFVWNGTLPNALYDGSIMGRLLDYEEYMILPRVLVTAV